MNDISENGADIPRSTKRARTSLIEQFGGACQVCGYDRCRRALQFHHKDASEKAEWSKSRGGASNREVRAHPERFVLLCSNCHIEEHDRLDAANQVIAECSSCGKTFETKACLLAVGKGKYCSKQCQHDLRTKNAPNTLATRFWKKVQKTDKCWLWTGFQQNGCGFIQTWTAEGHRPQTAHRVSWELHRGPVPDGLEVLQTCGNCCVRPDHLQLGDRAAVAAKTVRLGRTTRGERSASTNLTEEQVREIRQRYAAGGISQAALGFEYGITGGAASDIIRGRRWAHVE